jgi:DNA-binding transcriptional LysR family regulator
MLQNLDRLKVFYHVFKLESAVAAADRLFVSQSAVSQAIQKLEREVNSPLFIRLHKQLVPTAAGQQLYEIVRPFMTALDAYLKGLGMAKDHPVGELRIGVPPEFGKAYLPSIVAGFREQYPDVSFTLKFGTPETLLPQLRKGLVDFALVDVFLTRNTHPGSLDMFHFDPVVEEEVILACSRQYHETRVKGDHSFAALLKQDFIGYTKELQTVKQWFKHHFSKKNIQVRSVLTVDSHRAVISAITSHIGLGVVVSHLVKEELNNGQIVHIKTAGPEIINSISLAHLQDKIPTLTEKVFERYLVDRVRKMISQGNVGMTVPGH